MPSEVFNLRMLFNLMPSMGFFSWVVADDLIFADKKYAELYEIDMPAMAAGIPVELILSRIAQEDRNDWPRAFTACCSVGNPSSLPKISSIPAGSESLSSAWALARVMRLTPPSSIPEPCYLPAARPLLLMLLILRRIFQQRSR